MDTKSDINALFYSRRIKIMGVLTLGILLPLLMSLILHVFSILANILMPDFNRHVNFTSLAMFLIMILFFNLLDRNAEIKTSLAADLFYKIGVRPTVKEKSNFLEKRRKEIETEMEFLNKDEKDIIEKKKKLLEELGSL